MSRSQGFARGDLDTSFPLDDKFLALRRLPPERYYAAAGVYFHVAAATWREAERKIASRVCPDATAEIADLVAVGLLDSDECVTRRAFTHTIGRAKRARMTDTARKARNRAGMSGVTPPDRRGTPPESRAVPRTVQSSTVQSSTVQSSTEQEGDAREARPPTPRRIVLDWLKANGYREPSGWAHKTFDEMVAVLGPDVLIPILADGKASGIKFTTPLVQFAERSQSPRNGGPKPGKYLEHDPKELTDAFARE